MENKIYAPVIIPTLCRYDSLKKCIESIKECTGAQDTELYIGLDYPSKEGHWDGYRKINEYIDTITGFKNVHLYRRTSNLGEVKNVGDLVNIVSEKYDRYILSEDDNIYSPNFLEFVNEGLEKYKDDPNVIAICGYNYPFSYMNSLEGYDKNIMPIAYFSGWGVGRWIDKLPSHFVNSETAKSIVFSWRKVFVLWKKNQHITVHRLLFRYKNAYSDLLWRIYCVFENKYCIMPAVSKVRNLGFNSEGTNCASIDIYEQQQIDKEKSFVYDDVIIQDYLPVKRAQERLTGGNLVFKFVCFFEYLFFRISGKTLREMKFSRKILKFRVKKLGVSN